jgi:hypothetical protein
VQGRASPCGAEQTGGEQQRVPGQEEPHQEPGLGEHDQENPERPEGGRQAVRIQQVERRYRGKDVLDHTFTFRFTGTRKPGRNRTSYY